MAKMVQSFSRKDQYPPMDLEKNETEIAHTKPIAFREIDTSLKAKYPSTRKRKRHNRSSHPSGSKRLRQGSQPQTIDETSKKDENRMEDMNSADCLAVLCNQNKKDEAGLPVSISRTASQT